MTEYDPNAEVLRLLDSLCDRREYGLLRAVLMAWPHNGLTDGIEELVQSLKSIRRNERLTDTEKEMVGLAIEGYSAALYRR